MKNYKKWLTIYSPEDVQELNNYLSAYEGCQIYEFQKGVDVSTFAPFVVYQIYSNLFVESVTDIFVDISIELLGDKKCQYTIKKIPGERYGIITKKEEVKNVESKPRKWYQYWT